MPMDASGWIFCRLLRLWLGPSPFCRHGSHYFTPASAAVRPFPNAFIIQFKSILFMIDDVFMFF